MGQAEVVIGVHFFGVDPGGALEIGARFFKFAERQFAMAALGEDVGVIGGDGQGARAGLDGFAILPDSGVGLGQFQQQVRILGIGGEGLLRGRDHALAVGDREKLRAQRRSDLQDGFSARLTICQRRQRHGKHA